MKLLNIQPDSCYLMGSTGPLAGARKLCGVSADKFSDRELGEIIDNLARYLSVSYSVMEDTLCVWQKKQTKWTAEHSPDITYPAFVAIRDIRRAVKP
jgi:hypothetical protein